MLHCENGVFVSHDCSLFRGCPIGYGRGTMELKLYNLGLLKKPGCTVTEDEFKTYFK